MSLLPTDLLSFFWGAAVTLVFAFVTGFLRKAGAAAFDSLRNNFSRPPSDHDKSLFQQFQEEVAAAPTLRLFKVPDFEDSFRREDLRPLNTFVAEWGGVEKEFVDPKIEEEKKKLYKMAEELASEIALLTVPVGDGTRSSVYSDARRRLQGVDERLPEDVIEEARRLNTLATPFANAYESFVRLCRERLKR